LIREPPAKLGKTVNPTKVWDPKSLKNLDAVFGRNDEQALLQKAQEIASGEASASSNQHYRRKPSRQHIRGRIFSRNSFGLLTITLLGPKVLALGTPAAWFRQRPHLRRSFFI
jgi:hypothetical protein